MISTLRLQQSPFPSLLALVGSQPACKLSATMLGLPLPPPSCLLLTSFSWIGDNDNFRTFLGTQGGMYGGRGAYGGGCQVVVLPTAAAVLLELLGELCA